MSISTRTMTEKEQALILFAIRELQGNIAMNENVYPDLLDKFYDCAIATDQELLEALEELAQSINSGESEDV